MRECLIMSTHSKYQFFKYNNVNEIPKDWLKKHIGPYIHDIEEQETPISMFDGLELIGYKYFKVYNCKKGKLMYFNNEIGFRYHTGSYMYIRFLYHKDCEEYLRQLLNDYKLELKENFYANKYKYNCGDIITFSDNIQFEIDTNAYEEMLGLPKDSTTLDYFNKNENERPPIDVYYQIQTLIEGDDNTLLIVPGFIPDVNQFRLKGIPGAPYFSVGPNNMFLPEEHVKVYKNFEDDSKEL